MTPRLPRTHESENMSIKGILPTNVNELTKEAAGPWLESIVHFGSKNQFEEPPASQRQSITLAKELLKKHRSYLISLWETFTQERDDITKNLFGKKETALAYLAGFHLGNVARTLGSLRRASERLPDFAEKTKGKHIHLFDIACGTGAASIAATYFFRKNYTRSITYYLTDASANLLDMARYQIERISPTSKIFSQKKLIEETPLEKFSPQNGLNIYILGYIWNEIDKNAHAKNKLEKIFQKIANDENPCLLIISEPASEQQARNATILRDSLCDHGFNVAYPCPNSQFCPISKHEKGRDWCYSEFSWERPYLQKFIDTMLDVKRTNLGSSSYILSNKALNVEKPKNEHQVIVGKPKQLKTKDSPVHLLICSGGKISKSRPTKNSEKILKGELYFPNQSTQYEQ